jgi:hypothetical protein
MVELLSDGEQSGAVVGAGDDPVAAKLATEDLDLGFQEPDAGVPARGAGFNEEVSKDVEPAQHGL